MSSYMLDALDCAYFFFQVINSSSKGMKGPFFTNLVNEGWAYHKCFCSVKVYFSKSSVASDNGQLVLISHKTFIVFGNSEFFY